LIYLFIIISVISLLIIIIQWLQSRIQGRKDNEYVTAETKFEDKE